MPKEKKDSNLNEQEKRKEEETPIIEEDNDKIVVVDNKESTARKYWWVWMIIAILVVAAIVLACVYGCQPNNNNEDETTLVEPGAGSDLDSSSETKTDEEEGTTEGSGDTSGNEGSGSGGTSGEEESGDDDSSSGGSGSGSGGTSGDEGSGSGGTSGDEGSGSGGTSGDEGSGSGSGGDGSGSGSGSSDDDDDNDDDQNTGMSVDDVLSYIESINTNSIATWSCLSGHYETESEENTNVYDVTYDIAITYNEDGYIYGYDKLVVTDSESSDYTITYNYYTGTETYTYVYTYSNTTGSGDSEFSYTPTITLEETTYSEYLSSNTISTLSSVLSDITTTITSDNDALIDASLNEGLEVTTFSVTYNGTDGYQYKIDVDSETQDESTVVTTYTITTYSGEETISIITYSLITYTDLNDADWTSEYESELENAKATYEQEVYQNIIKDFVSSYTQTSSLTENWEGISYITDTSIVVVTTDEDGNLYGYTETTVGEETTYTYYGEDGVYTKVDTTYTYSEETDDTYSQFTAQAESDYLIEYVSDLVNTITSSGATISDVTLEDDYTLEVTYTTDDTTYKVTIVKDSDTGDLSSFTLETTTYEDGYVSGTTNVSISALTRNDVTTPDWYTSDQGNFEAAKGEYEEEKRVSELLDTISSFIGTIENISSSTDLADSWDGLTAVSYLDDDNTSTILLTDNGGTLYGYVINESDEEGESTTYYLEDGYYYTKEAGDETTYEYGKTTETYNDYVSSIYEEYINTYINGLIETLKDEATTIIDVEASEYTLVVTYSEGDITYKETIVTDSNGNLTSLTLDCSNDGESYTTQFSVGSTNEVELPTETSNEQIEAFLYSLNLEYVKDWEGLLINNKGTNTNSMYDYYDLLTEDDSGNLYGYQLSTRYITTSDSAYMNYIETYYIEGYWYERNTKVYDDSTSTSITYTGPTQNGYQGMYAAQISGAYNDAVKMVSALESVLGGDGTLESASITHEDNTNTLVCVYTDSSDVRYQFTLVADSDGNVLHVRLDYLDEYSNITAFSEYGMLTKDEVIIPEDFNTGDYTS